MSRRLNETMSKFQQKQCQSGLVLMPAMDRDCRYLSRAFANCNLIHPLLAEARETKPEEKGRFRSLEPKMDQVLASEHLCHLEALTSSASHPSHHTPILTNINSHCTYFYQCLDQVESGPKPKHWAQEYMLLTTMLISGNAEDFTT